MSLFARTGGGALDQDRRRLIETMYRAFNERDVDGALALLAPGVDWPNGMTGGRISGRDTVRAYWLKQWQETNPRVEPLQIDLTPNGARVRVDQLVKDRAGDIVSSSELEHVYEFDGSFITRMTVVDLGGGRRGDDDDEDN